MMQVCTCSDPNITQTEENGERIFQVESRTVSDRVRTNVMDFFSCMCVW